MIDRVYQLGLRESIKSLAKLKESFCKKGSYKGS